MYNVSTAKAHFYNRYYIIKISLQLRGIRSLCYTENTFPLTSATGMMPSVGELNFSG